MALIRDLDFVLNKAVVVTKSMVAGCRSIFEKTAMSNITFDVSTLVRANAIDIHAPVMPPEPIRTQTAIAFSGEVFPYALIIIACVILILGIAGIIYICVSWSR